MSRAQAPQVQEVPAGYTYTNSVPVGYTQSTPFPMQPHPPTLQLSALLPPTPNLAHTTQLSKSTLVPQLPLNTLFRAHNMLLKAHNMLWVEEMLATALDTQ